MGVKKVRITDDGKAIPKRVKVSIKGKDKVRWQGSRKAWRVEFGSRCPFTGKNFNAPKGAPGKPAQQKKKLTEGTTYRYKVTRAGRKGDPIVDIIR